MNEIVAQKLKKTRLLIGDNQLTASNKRGVRQKDVSLMSQEKKYIPIEYLVYMLNHKIDLNTLVNENTELKRIQNYRPIDEIEIKIKELSEVINNVMVSEHDNVPGTI
ncbi:hypothetical protein LQ567_16755 [Niabella pedocola]|uniref:HTH cro/C1-type domain-containing protein n=1 Tax=Niabella pedocola TaxID=1752077 RepID=A0ABS8PTM4_9BACT|nr:hypothetical protein [Niabella pedocola]MCD2424432.1 hypothetical protein [Niabella pedocola]